MLKKQMIPVLFLCLSTMSFMVACNPQGSSQSSSGSNWTPPITLPPVGPAGTNEPPSKSDDKTTPPPADDQSSADKSSKDTEVAKANCPDTLKPDPLNPTTSENLLSSPCHCKKEGPYESIHLFIIGGQGNSAADSFRNLMGSDLGTGAKTAKDSISPFVEKSGNKTHALSVPGVVAKGSTTSQNQMMNENMEAIEKEFQALVREINPCKRSLLLIMINDHGSTNGTTSFPYFFLLQLIIKYIPCCVDVEIVNGACESSAIADPPIVSSAVQASGGEILDPMKASWRAAHPEHPKDEPIPPEVFKEMMNEVYQKIPKCHNIHLSYAALVRGPGGPHGESNYNPVCSNGGYFVGWAKGFAESANKSEGVISEQTLIDAQAAGNAAKGSADQTPGRVEVDVRGEIEKIPHK